MPYTRFHRFLPFAAFLFVLGISIHARGAESTPILVELFTSEGCSSCPPADTYLRVLDNTQPLDGVQFIVMEEHVDYWDDLGWKDPFSARELTVRQNAYSQRLNASGPYTPEMVIDGAFDVVGSDRSGAANAFTKARGFSTVPIRISSARVQDGRVLAEVDSNAVMEKAEVFAALAIDHADSQVRRGENGGRHLQHVAIVKSISKLGTAGKGQTFSKALSLEANGLPRPLRLIVFLQEPGQGKITGAAVTVVP